MPPDFGQVVNKDLMDGFLYYRSLFFCMTQYCAILRNIAQSLVRPSDHATFGVGVSDRRRSVGSISDRYRSVGSTSDRRWIDVGVSDWRRIDVGLMYECQIGVGSTSD